MAPKGSPVSCWRPLPRSELPGPASVARAPAVPELAPGRGRRRALAARLPLPEDRGREPHAAGPGAGWGPASSGAEARPVLPQGPGTPRARRPPAALKPKPGAQLPRRAAGLDVPPGPAPTAGSSRALGLPDADGAPRPAPGDGSGGAAGGSRCRPRPTAEGRAAQKAALTELSGDGSLSPTFWPELPTGKEVTHPGLAAERKPDRARRSDGRAGGREDVTDRRVSVLGLASRDFPVTYGLWSRTGAAQRPDQTSCKRRLVPWGERRARWELYVCAFAEADRCVRALEALSCVGAKPAAEQRDERDAPPHGEGPRVPAALVRPDRAGRSAAEPRLRAA
ncbi:uncharacterized protein LOC114206009 [Eumetopias jubatus]|uniref:uncharacterized protein LOC114206009 n=1 Tax=Eumetopias jubatus TaxID=34886 RepID=UPI00101633D7|nr:uncharacterized protein LOC114206009 [Eumetopias jubatus]